MLDPDRHECIEEEYKGLGKPSKSLSLGTSASYACLPRGEGRAKGPKGPPAGSIAYYLGQAPPRVPYRAIKSREEG